MQFVDRCRLGNGTACIIKKFDILYEKEVVWMWNCVHGKKFESPNLSFLRSMKKWRMGFQACTISTCNPSNFINVFGRIGRELELINVLLLQTSIFSIRRGNVSNCNGAIFYFQMWLVAPQSHRKVGLKWLDAQQKAKKGLPQLYGPILYRIHS